VTEILSIPLDQLVADPDNPRTRMSVPELKELAASIKAEGQLQAGQVRANGDGKYHIVFGHRRYAALLLLENDGTSLPFRAELVDETDEATITITQLIENLQRVDLDPIDEAEALAKLLERNIKAKEIAVRIGRSQAHVSKRVAMSKLPDIAKKAVREGKTTVENAYEMAKVCPEYADEVAALYRDPGFLPHSGTVSSMLTRIERAEARNKIFTALQAKGIEAVDSGTVDFAKVKQVQRLTAGEIDKIDLGDVVGDEAVDRFVAVHCSSYSEPEIQVFEPLPKKTLGKKEAEADKAKTAERERNRKERDAKGDRLQRAVAIAKKPARKEVLPMLLLKGANRAIWQADQKLVCQILALEPLTRTENRIVNNEETTKEVPDYAGTLQAYVDNADEAKLLRLCFAGYLADYVRSEHSDRELAAYVEANTELVVEDVEPEPEVVSLGEERKRRRGAKEEQAGEG
jgi:ParB/RepB/Spo0J family partition protein